MWPSPWRHEKQQGGTMADSFDIRNSAFGICPVPPVGESAGSFRNLPFASFHIRNSAFGICPVPPAGESAGSFRNLPFASFDIRNSAFDIFLIHHLAPQGMAGRCKGRVQKSELRSFRVFNSTFEIHHSQFAPSSNQSGDCNARSARREWASNSQGLGSQRDIRRALIEADLVPRVTPTGKSLRRKVRKMCLPFAQENFSELCEE